MIILAYFAAMVWIGLHFKNRVKVTDDYYLAGRSLNFFVIMATVCASIIGGGAMIGRGGITYSQGAVAVLLAIPYLVGMYVFSMISGRIQRVGISNGIGSIPDLMEYRFGSAARYMTAILVSFTMMATVGTQITATATIIKTIGGISYEAGAWMAVAIFVSYTVFSGLFGVVYTDVAQFLILMVFMYILLPIMSLSRIGGVSGLWESVPPEMLAIKPSVEMIGWIFTNLVFTLAGAEMWQRAFAARSPGDARKGMFLGTTAYGYTILVTLTIGLSAFVLIPDVVAKYGSADAAIPALAVEILPVGIAGLTIAGLLAVLMSSADTYLLISVQSILSDIIKHAVGNMDEKKELLLSRIFTVGLGVGALLISLYIRQAYRALMFAWTFYSASLGIPAFAALYWRKATRAGIIGSIASGFSVSILWRIFGNPLGLSPAIPGSMASLIILIIVSLATCETQPSRFPELEG